jgi:thiol-disulfide isomerase/thioredoxin
MKMKLKDVVYILIGVAVIAAVSFTVLSYMNKRSEGFSDGSNFTLYYADWCPHCKAVKPIFSQWSSSGTVNVQNKTVSTQMVEADTNPELVSKAGVKGFPTMILTKSDGTTMEYKGERSVTAWEDWLSSHL